MVADLPLSGRTAKVMKDNNTKIFRSPFIAHKSIGLLETIPLSKHL